MQRHLSISVLFFGLLLSLGWEAPLRADVLLSHVFGSHMVLQQDMEIPVWGWADPGEEVSVQLGDSQAVKGETNGAGKWQVKLPAAEAGGPFVLKVTGKNSITLEDVLVGEVWICSGQSNMAFVVASSRNAAEEIAAAKFPRIRHLTIPRKPSGFPVANVDATWQVCSPETAGSFSACAFFMGRNLHRDLNVPVGLINTSWGGTRIEPWTPPAGFKAVPALKEIYQKVLLTNPKSKAYKDRLAAYLAQSKEWMGKAEKALASEAALEPMPAYPKELAPLASHQDPSTLYNGMVHPLVPFAFRGAIWYQGESNHHDGHLYTEKMKALIGGWRQIWRQGEFPFFYVQIAPYQYGNENPVIIGEFWEAQAAALAIPNTGMVVTTDIGNIRNIHPTNKQEVGRRLALLALNRVYDRNIISSGPAFQSMKVEGDHLRVVFGDVGDGLKSRDGKPLTWFEIIGKETDFVKAEARAEGDSVILSSPRVKQPVAMRFAWSKLAEPNLVNSAGLPASAFRAGNVPVRDYLALRVPQAKEYQLVYALDLAKLGPKITYDVDNRAKILGKFDRVAYFFELQKPGEPVQYVYVSMKAFTDDLSKIGIPTVATKARFQQKVADLTVVTNVNGLAAGEGLKGGNIEFWPNNYGPLNAAKVPNASSAIWDFGDQVSGSPAGYGSMQVHNYEAKQTILAINHWNNRAKACIGIGNSTGKTRDWTFADNGESYSLKKLRVLVRPAR